MSDSDSLSDSNNYWSSDSIQISDDTSSSSREETIDTVISPLPLLGVLGDSNLGFHLLLHRIIHRVRVDHKKVTGAVLILLLPIPPSLEIPAVEQKKFLSVVWCVIRISVVLRVARNVIYIIPRLQGHCHRSLVRPGILCRRIKKVDQKPSSTMIFRRNMLGMRAKVSCV